MAGARIEQALLVPHCGEHLVRYLPQTASKADSELLEAFVLAFRQANAEALFRSYRELSDGGLRIEQVRFLQGRAWFYFKDPDGIGCRSRRQWEAIVRMYQGRSRECGT